MEDVRYTCNMCQKELSGNRERRDRDFVVVYAFDPRETLPIKKDYCFDCWPKVALELGEQDG